MKDKILIQAWTVYKFNKNYYIEYTHSIYLETLKKYYNEIHLISPTKTVNELDTKPLYKINKSIVVHELAYFQNYVYAYKHFFSYLKIYKKLSKIKYNTIYTRFPSPFGWLQKLYFKQNRVVHFVGDPIDTVKQNNKLNSIFKVLKISLFLPEFFLFIWACKGNVKVFSNGHHIAEKLKKFNVAVSPLISTTLTQHDFYNRDINTSSNCNNLIYVGYLRKAKGVNTVIEAFKILNEKFPNKYNLTIVGDGEEFEYLKEFSERNKLNIVFTGHINNREELNSILRANDIFCFASLSEGSPRVILEAIANSLNVISTPVGSLPYIFKNNEDILYFNYSDSLNLANLIEYLNENEAVRSKLLENSQEKVKNFKIDNFIRKAFDA